MPPDSACFPQSQIDTGSRILTLKINWINKISKAHRKDLGENAGTNKFTLFLLLTQLENT